PHPYLQTILISAALWAAATLPALAAEGGIDPAFGTHSGVTFDNFLPETHGLGADAACLDPMGRIVTFSYAGTAADEPVASYGVMLLTANGIPDDEFSFDGRMRILPEAFVWTHLRSISCRNDGSIIVGFFVHTDKRVTVLHRITNEGE